MNCRTAKNNPNVPEELRNPKISLEDALTILNRNKSTLILDFEKRGQIPTPNTKL